MFARPLVPIEEILPLPIRLSDRWRGERPMNISLLNAQRIDRRFKLWLLTHEFGIDATDPDEYLIGELKMPGLRQPDWTLLRVRPMIRIDAHVESERDRDKAQVDDF